MQQQEFGLFECYIMAACRGMKAIISNGKLEGFTKESDNGVQIQENHHENVRMVRERV